MENLVEFLRILSALAKLKIIIVPSHFSSDSITIFQAGVDSWIEQEIITYENVSCQSLLNVEPGEYAVAIQKKEIDRLDDETLAILVLIKLFVAIDANYVDRCLLNFEETVSAQLGDMQRAAAIVGTEALLEAKVKYGNPVVLTGSPIIMQPNTVMFKDIMRKAMINVREPTPEQAQFNMGVWTAVYRGRLAASAPQ